MSTSAEETGSPELRTAIRAARSGGRAALAFYGRATVTNQDPKAPVTEADRASNAAVLEVLRGAFPDAAILSEEGGGRAGRADEDLWIIDPLDGTKEFLTENGEFSVMVGLVRGGRPVVGAVYAPAQGCLYWAERGRGAWITEAGRVRALRAEVARPGRLRMVGSRSHADPLVERMAAAVGVHEVRPSGSVGLKCGLIARGACDLYVHPVPYIKEWDTCAPEIILTEAGGMVTDCMGEPLRYGKEDPCQPAGILACGAEMPEDVLATCRELYRETVPVG